MRIAVIAIEGVLAETANLMNSPPTKVGKPLFDGLRQQYRVILISSQPDFELARYWLKKEGFIGYAMMLTYKSDGIMGQPAWKVSSIREMLADGWEVGLVIDVDPRVVQGVLQEGVPVMQLSYPTIAPGRLPETPGPLRSWNDIATTLEQTALVKEG